MVRFGDYQKLQQDDDEDGIKQFADSKANKKKGFFLKRSHRYTPLVDPENRHSSHQPTATTQQLLVPSNNVKYTENLCEHYWHLLSRIPDYEHKCGTKLPLSPSAPRIGASGIASAAATPNRNRPPEKHDAVVHLYRHRQQQAKAAAALIVSPSIHYCHRYDRPSCANSHKPSQQRTIRKFMKGLLRQKLESIAGKVLAVASAAGSPLRQAATTTTRGGGREGGGATAAAPSSASRGGGGGAEESSREASVRVSNHASRKDDGSWKQEEENEDDDDDIKDELVRWEEDGYVEVRNSRLKVINNNLSGGGGGDSTAEGAGQIVNDTITRHPTATTTVDNLYANQFDGMQDVLLRVERPTHGSSPSSPSHHPTTTNNTQHQHQHPLQSQLLNNNQQPHNSHQTHPRPMHLFTNPNLNCDNNLQLPNNQNNHHQQQQQHHRHQQNQPPHQLLLQHHHNNIQSRSPSSEEDNSPTEMNNCRRLIDKPPLVKRLTMGLLRTTEDSRPLVQNNSSSSPSNSGFSHTISDGYVNEGICDPDLKLITSKFGDSCRKSLTSVMDKKAQLLETSACEFDFKKNVLRETSSANSSPKIFAASAPRFETAEHHELKGAPWFQAGLPREISLEVLSRQSPGAFLVRQSSTKPGCFALSLRVPPPAPKVAHYLILKTQRGYKIKGFTKEFSSLRALITHHSVMPELLPVPLALPRPQNIIPQRRHLDDFDTYGSLNDFRKMMSDLNV